jgi:hypothetical protein
MVGTNYSLLLLHGDSVVISIRSFLQTFLCTGQTEFIWTRPPHQTDFTNERRLRLEAGMPWGLLGEQTRGVPYRHPTLHAGREVR